MYEGNPVDLRMEKILSADGIFDDSTRQCRVRKYDPEEDFIYLDLMEDKLEAISLDGRHERCRLGIGQGCECDLQPRNDFGFRLETPVYCAPSSVSDVDDVTPEQFTVRTIGLVEFPIHDPVIKSAKVVD